MVVTQSVVEVSYGQLGLALMRGGLSAEQALKALLSVDPFPEVRQVAMRIRMESSQLILVANVYLRPAT
ncbi:MAG: DUF1028 domain-containing protein [Nitrososphaerota archaeon]